MKILVVGSNGFIGSHCISYFSKKHDVWGCDVILDYSRPKYFIIDSINTDYKEIFRNHKFDVCINCSGAANVSYSLDNPHNDFTLNTINVFNLLEAIRLYNPECKFITMSSAAVYGNPQTLPVKPDSMYNPVSPYGYHKVYAEYLCEEFYKFWNIPTCCVRIFSAYGPGLRKQIFWDIYNKIKNDEVVKMWGTGRETRDFIYITDVLYALDIIITHAEFKSEKINIANGCQTSIKEVVDTFINITKTEKPVVFNGETRIGDPINWEADISVITSWGYKPEINLETGINEYIRWIND